MNAARPDPSRKLGVAIIGCGEIALHNARAALDSMCAEVRWAVDGNLDLARDLSRRWGGTPVANASPALDDPRVDAVVVCTPHHLHAPQCLEAIARGKHVLVEKPMGRSAQEAATMIDAARAAGVVLATFFPKRLLPEAKAGKSLVEQGALGRVVGARITEHVYRETAYWFGGNSGRSRSNWRARRETSGGGVLLMNLCHHLDELLYITGLRAERVYCEAGRFAAPGDVEDLISLAVRTADGAIVSVDAGTCAPGVDESTFSIWGADGQIALDDPPRFLSLRTNSIGSPNRWSHLPRGTEREARRDFLRAFAGAVLEGSANPVPPEEALTVQLLIDAAYRSAERHEPVVVPSEPKSWGDVASND